jgi:hypothetical protein
MHKLDSSKILGGLIRRSRGDVNGFVCCDSEGDKAWREMRMELRRISVSSGFVWESSSGVDGFGARHSGQVISKE